MMGFFLSKRAVLFTPILVLIGVFVWVFYLWRSNGIFELVTPEIPGNGKDKFCIQDLEFLPATDRYEVLGGSDECLPGIQFPDFPGLSVTITVSVVR